MSTVCFSAPEEVLAKADRLMAEANAACMKAMQDPCIGGRGMDLARSRGAAFAAAWLDERRPKGYRSKSAFITAALEHYSKHVESQLEAFKNAKS